MASRRRLADAGRCMPWPLAVLCWLDTRLHDHAHGPGLACKAHDKVMIAWWKMPAGVPVTVRIEIDLNVRVRGGQTFAGYEDVDLATVTRTRASRADGPVAVGDKVIVTSTPDEIEGDAMVVGERVLGADATVTDVDAAKRLIYLAVDWHSFRDVDTAQAARA